MLKCAYMECIYPSPTRLTPSPRLSSIAVATRTRHPLKQGTRGHLELDTVVRPRCHDSYHCTVGVWFTTTPKHSNSEPVLSKSHITFTTTQTPAKSSQSMELIFSLRWSKDKFSTHQQAVDVGSMTMYMEWVKAMCWRPDTRKRRLNITYIYLTGFAHLSCSRL